MQLIIENLILHIKIIQPDLDCIVRPDDVYSGMKYEKVSEKYGKKTYKC